MAEFELVFLFFFRIPPSVEKKLDAVPSFT